MSSSQKITIARVIARLNVGGPAMQAILMTAAFRQKGYQTVLLTGEVPAGEGSMEYLALAKDVEPIKIVTMSRRISWLKDLASLWQLVRILHRKKPLIIHTHTAKAGALGRVAAIFTGVPVRVHTFHGHVFHGYFSPLVTRVFLMIERWLARRTDCIIAVSESQRRELIEKYCIASPQKIVSIPLGFELDPFIRVNGRKGSLSSSLGHGPETKVVGWVGRFARIKAPHLFLDCAVKVHRRFSNARFVMVGDGELRREIEDRMQRERMDTIVTITGWQRELSGTYSDLYLVVLTSINEGTPVTLLETMASARPFVATDVGGVRDLMSGCGRVDDGLLVFDNGILVPRDAQLLAHAVIYLLERPAVSKAMGQAGREFVCKQFSQHRLANDLETLYLSLAKSKGLLRRIPDCSWPVPTAPSPKEIATVPPLQYPQARSQSAAELE